MYLVSFTNILGIHTGKSLSLTPAVAGYDRPTSTRVVSHGPTHGSATGALQPLEGWTAALEQSAGQDSPARQRHWRISSAAKVVLNLFK